MENVDKKVLCVGLSCLDIVMYCRSYPVEDSDQSSMNHKWQRGGNASNNSTIFAEFNIPCEILSVISCDIGGEFLKQDFKKHNISTENCHFSNEYESRMASVWVNLQNGTRTILCSNNNIPEVSFEDFKQLNLNNYKWIHFEGRPNPELKIMIQHVREWNEMKEHSTITISIEIEKPKEEHKDLLALGDFVFISKDFAWMLGLPDMKTAVQSLCSFLRPNGVVICAWGEKGASAKDLNGPVHASYAFEPEKLVSTLGAGDTFIAATIIALLKGMGIGESIEMGCRVAGKKCGMYDSKGLSESFPNLLR